MRQQTFPYDDNFNDDGADTPRKPKPVIPPGDISLTSRAKTLHLAQQWLQRAKYHTQAIDSCLEVKRFAAGISHAQASTELSLKILFLLFSPEKMTDSHDSQDISRLKRSLPQGLKSLPLAQLFLYSRFWLIFYTLTRYDYEPSFQASGQLFTASELKLAKKHAKQCLKAAQLCTAHLA